MTRRQAGVIGALCVLLALALNARVLVHGVRRILNRPIMAAVRETPEVSEVSQAIEPRDPSFLQPQRLDAWQIIGPGGGGNFYGMAISPHDPNLVFASTEMGDCYVSENGGHTWRLFNLWRTCAIVFDPQLPNRVYALTIGLWRSDDRGRRTRWDGN